MTIIFVYFPDASNYSLSINSDFSHTFSNSLLHFQVSQVSSKLGTIVLIFLLFKTIDLVFSRSIPKL